MPDYSKGKIYTIRCRTDDTLIYVGSTIETLAQRLTKHKATAKIHPNGWHKIINDWNDWYIELYEDFPCERREQLLKREGEIIREFGTLNKRIECRTKKEYYVENTDKILEQRREYRIQNIDKIKERDKEYYIHNIEKIKEYQKEYRIANVESKKEYHKRYYIENANKLKEYQKEKVICECGCKISKGEYKNHQKTQKHLQLLADKTQHTI